MQKLFRSVYKFSDIGFHMQWRILGNYSKNRLIIRGQKEICEKNQFWAMRSQF